MKIHTFQLRKKEWISEWSSQLNTQLMQLRKESLKKNSGLNGIRTHDLCDTGVVLYQLRYKANLELVLMWIRNSWKAIQNYLVSKFGGLDFLVTCDYDLNSLNLERLPEFYRTVLGYWQEFKLLTQSKEKPAKDQIIWNNHNIRLDWTTIFIRDWFNEGIVYIMDLLDAVLNFLSFFV